MSDTFRTLRTATQGIYKEKGSKFLAFAYHVEHIGDVKRILEEKRKEFHDARHICYAYMLGSDRSEFRANDDGEPSSTAGKPILGQINSLKLTNVLVIVVRYFGGILLGTGGLTTAYKAAANDALSKADIIVQTATCSIKISFGYEQTSLVQRLLKELQVEISSRHFDEQMTHLTLTLPKSRYTFALELFLKNNIQCEISR